MNVFSFQILDRYLLKQFAAYLVGITVILWLIYIATRFARYLAQAATGILPADIVITLLTYSSLGALSVLLPMATFFAVMLALGQMQSDSELTVIAASGIPKQRIIRNVLLFSTLAAAAVASLTLYIVPDILSKRYNLEQRAKLAASTAGLIGGEFKESRQGQWTFYSQSITDEQKMQDVFIEIQRGETPIIFRARAGWLKINEENGDKYLLLSDGYRYEGEPTQQGYRIIQFATHRVLIEKGKSQQINLKHKSLPSEYLWQRGSLKDLAELQWRVSTIIMTVILCLYAVVLTASRPRQGRYHRIVPAITIYIVYSNLLAVAKAWIAKGVISVGLGALGTHCIMVMALWLLYQRHMIRWWWQLYLQGKGGK